MWWSKRPSRVPSDVQEAIELREEAQQDLRDVKAQAPYVAQLTARLVERRALNHFGDELKVTFTPRGERHA